MKIRLNSNPQGASNCVEIRIVTRSSIERETKLIQSDWDFPGIASSFGWNIASVQIAGRKKPCQHSGTDGTVNCSECGASTGEFIGKARRWLKKHNGRTVDDPGYFL